MLVSALLALAPLALASPMATRQNQSAKIVTREDSNLCVTAYGLSPSAGDLVTVAPCKQPADQYYLHQYWIDGGLPSTGPVELAGFGLCIDAGSATPGEQTELTLQKCNGSAQQEWYWFGGAGIEINNQCWTRVDATAKTGVCAGTSFTQLQTSACKSSDNADQLFEPSTDL